MSAPARILPIPRYLRGIRQSEDSIQAGLRGMPHGERFQALGRRQAVNQGPVRLPARARPPEDGFHPRRDMQAPVLPVLESAGVRLAQGSPDPSACRPEVSALWHCCTTSSSFPTDDYAAPVQGWIVRPTGRPRAGEGALPKHCGARPKERVFNRRPS